LKKGSMINLTRMGDRDYSGGGCNPNVLELS
jgi:hypothetical protein